MNYKTIPSEVIKFENGHILIGIDINRDSFYVHTSDGIMNYNKSEMKEIYNF